MLLSSRDGVLVEVTIEGYENPDVCDNRLTANWLNARLHVETAHGSGTSVVAFLHTWDLPDFIEWLEQLGRGERVALPFMVFPEPKFQLGLVGETEEEVVLEVRFVLERPGEWTVDDQVDKQTYWAGKMRLAVTREMLLAAAASLRSEAQRFPTREVPV